MNKFLLFILLTLALSCQKSPIQLKSGSWQARLSVQDGQILPFIFEVHPDGTLTIKNAQERIHVDQITIVDNKIRIQTPVFEGYFEGVIHSDGTQISGEFIKPSLDRRVDFIMEYGISERFTVTAAQDAIKTVDLNGNWETVFSPNSPEDRYIAKGIFTQKGNLLNGTFRTTTGDYRFLEGIVKGNQFRLSTFDGAHAFLFTGQATDSTLEGYFYSGDHWKEAFRAKRNPNYELPDATTLTYLKEGYDRISFTFPDHTGKMVSLDDPEFDNKVVLVQILGSWCPNCLEETKFYSEYLKANPDLDLAVVGLAFEYAPTSEQAFKSIDRMVNRLEVPYPILLAQFGTEDKKLAQQKLPMLNHILSYPTTIFIDKNEEIRRIHTGFNGKATAQVYTNFTLEFDRFIKKLVSE